MHANVRTIRFLPIPTNGCQHCQEQSAISAHVLESAENTLAMLGTCHMLFYSTCRCQAELKLITAGTSTLDYTTLDVPAGITLSSA